MISQHFTSLRFCRGIGNLISRWDLEGVTQGGPRPCNWRISPCEAESSPQALGLTNKS